MKFLGFWVIPFICLMIFVKSTTQEEPHIVCYYESEGNLLPGNAKYKQPENINPYLCTHLIYESATFTLEDNTLRPKNKSRDIILDGYAKFNGLKTTNKNLKTLLATDDSIELDTKFSLLVSNADSRREFAKNAIIYLRQHKFDGLELGWIYPSDKDFGKPTDRANYAQFVQELREEFDRESSATGKSRLLLVVLINASPSEINRGFDVINLNQYVDWFAVMTYNYFDFSFDNATIHDSPLYSLDKDNKLSVDATIQYLISVGADRQKLILGIPTHGTYFMLLNPNATDIGAPITRLVGTLPYFEICQNIKNDGNWTVKHPNDNVTGPYMYKDGQWISYDDENIVRKKGQYAANNGLGGILFSTLGFDDFNGTCSGKPYPIIESAKEGLYEGLRIKSPNHKEIIITTTPHNGPTQTLSVSNKVPTNITQEPPTTSNPGSDFICKGKGFFSHPRDCKKYFWCLDSGSANLGQFTCPSDLLFNKQVDSCDHARNVICENTQSSIAKTASSQTTPSQTTTKLSTTPSTYDDDDKVDEDEIEDSEPEQDIEDTKVINELIELIKRAGGLEKLQKHLKFSEDNSALYDTVLFRKAENRLVKNKNDREVIKVTPEASNARYSSKTRNRQPIAQNSRIDNLSIFDILFKEKPQYVTIEKHKTSIKNIKIVW